MQNLDGQMDLFGLMGGGENEKPANDYKVPNLPEYSGLLSCFASSPSS